jgi:3'-5' exonuclease
MPRLVLDLETFALAEADQYLEPVSAPANYKDPEKMRAYCDDRRAELLKKCALDVDLCTVVVVGYQLESETVPTVWTAEQLTEAHLLSLAWQRIADRAVVGFNLLTFDLPVLIRRSQYLGIPIPDINLDRYRTPHIDLIEKLTFNGKLKMRSLDFWCRRFGIDVADSYSGEDVDALVKAGNWTAVADHCRADVTRTRDLAVRLGYLAAGATEVF